MNADLYHDPAHAALAHQLLTHPRAHDMVKTAEFEDDVSKLADGAFAWPTERRFPIHTPAHALVSALYVKLASDREVPRAVRANITEALSAYGVDPAVLQPQTVKEASAPEDYIFPEAGIYPVRSAAEVKTAEARLISQAGKLSLPARVEAFHKLAAAAERHGVTLAPASQAWGMSALSSPGGVLEGLVARSHLAKTASDKEAYSAMFQAVSGRPQDLRSFETRRKLASLLDETDRRTGLDKFWDRRIPDPLHTVFNFPAKTGAQHVQMGGEVYDLAALQGLPASFWADSLGPEIVSEIAPGGAVDPDQLAAILPTLPADMLASLSVSLRSTGIQPLGV